MILVYYIEGSLRILFTETRRSLVFPHNKVRKRLTKKLLVPYSWKSDSLPYRYLGRDLTEETVRKIENRVGYLYSL